MAHSDIDGADLDPIAHYSCLWRTSHKGRIEGEVRRILRWYIYTYIHIYIYTYIHIYIHTLATIQILI